MKKLVFLMMAILIASSAFAVVDPDPNMVGVYFDMEADTPTMEMAAFGPAVAYLILTNPTFDALYGFEAGLTFEGPATAPTATFANPQALNVGTATNQIVGFGSPTATSEATLLATLDFYYVGSGEPLYIMLHGTEPSSMDPAYPVGLLAGGELLSLGLSAMDGTVAAINGEVVATEAISLDNIKSLYR